MRTYDPTKDPAVAQELLERGVLGPDTVNMLWPTPEIVDAVVQQESSGNPAAIGPETKYGRARGAMQLLPSTAVDVAQKHGMPIPTEDDLLNFDTNKKLGTRYLADLYEKYGDEKLALAAYHSGPGNVDAAIKKAGTREPDAVIAQLGPVGRVYPDQTLGRTKTSTTAAAKTATTTPPKTTTATTGTAAAPAQPVPSDVVNQAAAMPAPAAPASDEPAVGERFESSIQAQQAAALEQLEAQRQISAKMAEVQLEEQERAKQQAAAELEQRNREQEAIQRARTSYETAVTDLTNSKVDPSRLWNNMSTPQKILAGISLVLGGISAGMTKSGKNPALDVIKHAIDNDIEAQRLELTAKDSATRQKGSLYSDLIQQTGSERAARESLRAIGYQSAKLQVETLSQQLSSAEKQGEAQRLVGELEQKAAEFQLKAEELAAKDPAAAAAKIDQVAAGTRDPKTLSKEDQERLVPGIGLARSATDAREISAAEQKFKDFTNKLDTLIELRKKHGSEKLPGKAKTQMKTTAAAAKLTLKSIFELGALSESDYAALNDLLGDPTAYSDTYGLGTDTVIEQYNALKKQALDSYKATLNSRLLEKFPTGKAATTEIKVSPGVR